MAPLVIGEVVPGISVTRKRCAVAGISMRNQASRAALGAAGGRSMKFPHGAGPATVTGVEVGVELNEKSPETGFSDPVAQAVVNALDNPAVVLNVREGVASLGLSLICPQAAVLTEQMMSPSIPSLWTQARWNRFRQMSVALDRGRRRCLVEESEVRERRMIMREHDVLRV